ncbi:MAG: RNA polymerase sigma factor [Candidatus Obscuribacter sp.]|jgi:RNA polymerase sigma-70 factor (ECF subfamily)|nr:RNA polymerase sigma factor [Candidatus Obscuribacter sp.]
MNKKKIADKDLKAAIESARRFARKHGAIGINDEDDLVQDLMVRWMKNSIAHVPPRAWMTKTMRCVVYDQLRKKQISPMLADDNLDTAMENGSVSESSVSYFHCDSVEVDFMPMLLSALSELTEAFRVALILDAEGYTYSEIASMTGAQIGTVRSRLHNARKKIRQYRHYFD